MEYIAENWDSILSIVNLIGLLIVGKYKKGKYND